MASLSRAKLHSVLMPWQGRRVSSSFGLAGPTSWTQQGWPSTASRWHQEMLGGLHAILKMSAVMKPLHLGWPSGRRDSKS